MRKLLCLGNALALVLLGFAAEGAAPVKKAPARQGTKSTTARKPGTASAKSGTSTRGKTSARAVTRRRTRRTTWRNRQLTPTPERYKEIQTALSAKGYLPADAANGKWTADSTEAMKKFQADQNLDANGKINSLSLIALGLGPKRDTSPAVKIPPPPSPAPTTP